MHFGLFRAPPLRISGFVSKRQSLLLPEEGEGGVVADVEVFGGYADEKLAVFGVPTGQFFLGKGGSYASA